jgi:putative PIN family toxin of toxin-antitoxin system
MRVVLDTNCPLVSISSRSKYHWLYEALLAGLVEVAISNEILTEYVEITQGRTYSETTLDGVYHFLMHAENSIRIEPTFRWNLIQADPDDNKFVDCALAANADYIVTEDKHYNVLKTIPFPKVRVVTMWEFSEILLKSSQ